MKNLTNLILLFLLSSAAVAQEHGAFASANETTAFDGNDLVSYFDARKPLRGSDKFTYDYQGMKLQFATKQNLEKFKINPEQYLPAYNGWCAIALTQGSWIRPDFNEYKIQDGRLLFFEVRAFYNGKTAWNKDPQLNEIVADHKFKELADAK